MAAKPAGLANWATDGQPELGPLTLALPLHVLRPRVSSIWLILKDIFDRVMAAAVLLGLLPLLIVIGLAIRLTSPGPIFSRQTVIGRRGRPFALLKFRTLRVPLRHDLLSRKVPVDAEGTVQSEDSYRLIKPYLDLRATPVGVFLRQTALDELPELLNVLLGSMSLVGPRPAWPEETAASRDDTLRRFLVKPGITGLWQISNLSGFTPHSSAELDLYYVDNWSFWLDMKILFRTIVVLFRSNPS